MSAALHTAEGWNGAQSQLREALAAHDHQDSPLPGGALDPEATLDLAELEVQRLRVAGVDVAEAARELLPSAGGTVRERMDVAGILRCAGGLKAGSTRLPQAPTLTRRSYNRGGYTLHRDDAGAAALVERAPQPALDWGPILSAWADPAQGSRWWDLPGLNAEFVLDVPRVALVHVQGWFGLHPDEASPHSRSELTLSPGLRLDVGGPTRSPACFVGFSGRSREDWHAVGGEEDTDHERIHGLSWAASLIGYPGAPDYRPLDTPFAALLGLPLPPGPSTVLLRAWGNPSLILSATLTVTLLPP